MPAADPVMADPMAATPAADPNAMEPGQAADHMMTDPNAMPEADANAMPEAESDNSANPQIEFITSMLSNMSDKDLDAVEAYAKSVNNKSKAQEEPQQMAETVTFTKKQLSSISETLRKNNTDGIHNSLNEKEPEARKKNKKSPFETKSFK